MLTVAEWAMSLQMQAARVRGHELTLEVKQTLEHVAKDAEDMIGTERPEWKPLAESTMTGYTADGGHHFPGKIELGYVNQVSPTDPLLRTGVLKFSISADATRSGLTVKGVVGSDDEVAVYQELGTPTIPPRPFLASAMVTSQQLVEESMGQWLQRVLTNRA